MLVVSPTGPRSRTPRHLPKAALPVMEGKAPLFGEFAGLIAPICLDNSSDTEEIIETIVRIALAAFGGINSR